MPEKTLLSIVIPVYKSENMVSDLIAAVSKEAAKITSAYEIVLVEDCGKDQSWQKVIECSKGNSNIKGIKLSRNFGQHNAITAGLNYAKGDWIIVMDCDFQDNPEYIPQLYTKALETNCDIVFAKRSNRNDGFLKRITSKIFYKIFAYLTDSNYDGGVVNYGIYNKKVIAAILTMQEPFKFFILMSRWVGFESTILDIVHSGRKSGKSSYTFKKLTRLALMIVLTYSQKPLILTVQAGFTISILSLAFVVYNLIRWYMGKIIVLGYSSLIASIWLIGGMIVFTLGILGLYLGKVLDGVKNRPVFIVDKTINID